MTPAIPVTRWAIGTAVLGRPAYLNAGADLPADRSVEALRRRTAEVLDAAADAGVDWVDTARSYGRAEEFVADWLAARRREGVELPRISSKWGYAYVGDWRTDADVHEVKEHSLARFTEQWAQTRALLGDVVGLYQVHSLTADSPLWDDDELVAAMAQLRDSGVALGFSTSGPDQATAIERGSSLQVDGVPLFSAVQSTWNIVDQSAAPALQAAHDAGMTVLLKETLANGLLVTDPPEPLSALAHEHGATTDAVALAIAATRPFADRVVLGPSSVDQLTDNLQAADLVLPDPAVHDLLVATRAAPQDYWARRSSLTWH